MNAATAHLDALHLAGEPLPAGAADVYRAAALDALRASTGRTYAPVMPDDPRPIDDSAAEAVLVALNAAAEARWASGETAARFAALRASAQGCL